MTTHRGEHATYRQHVTAEIAPGNHQTHRYENNHKTDNLTGREHLAEDRHAEYHRRNGFEDAQDSSSRRADFVNGGVGLRVLLL